MVALIKIFKTALYYGILLTDNDSQKIVRNIYLWVLFFYFEREFKLNIYCKCVEVPGPMSS